MDRTTLSFGQWISHIGTVCQSWWHAASAPDTPEEIIKQLLQHDEAQIRIADANAILGERFLSLHLEKTENNEWIYTFHDGKPASKPKIVKAYGKTLPAEIAEAIKIKLNNVAIQDTQYQSTKKRWSSERTQQLIQYLKTNGLIFEKNGRTYVKNLHFDSSPTLATFSGSSLRKRLSKAARFLAKNYSKYEMGRFLQKLFALKTPPVYLSTPPDTNAWEFLAILKKEGVIVDDGKSTAIKNLHQATYETCFSGKDQELQLIAHLQHCYQNKKTPIEEQSWGNKATKAALGSLMLASMSLPLFTGKQSDYSPTTEKDSSDSTSLAESSTTTRSLSETGNVNGTWIRTAQAGSATLASDFVVIDDQIFSTGTIGPFADTWLSQRHAETGDAVQFARSGNQNAAAISSAKNGSWLIHGGFHNSRMALNAITTSFEEIWSMLFRVAPSIVTVSGSTYNRIASVTTDDQHVYFGATTNAHTKSTNINTYNGMLGKVELTSGKVVGNMTLGGEGGGYTFKKVLINQNLNLTVLLKADSISGTPGLTDHVLLELDKKVFDQNETSHEATAIGSGGYDNPENLIQLSNGHYQITGDGSNGGTHLFVGSYNQSFHREWERRLYLDGASVYGRDLAEVGNDTFAVGFMSGTVSAGSFDCLMALFETITGTLHWVYRAGGELYDVCTKTKSYTSQTQTSPQSHDVIITGNTRSTTSDGNQAALEIHASIDRSGLQIHNSSLGTKFSAENITAQASFPETTNSQTSIKIPRNNFTLEAEQQSDPVLPYPFTSIEEWPESSPTPAPSAAPSTSPSLPPSAMPSPAPTHAPSGSPSEQPSPAPSMWPSWLPSLSPSALPSWFPSLSPSQRPSPAPSDSPSASPSQPPSQQPSVTPSNSPSSAPSESPSETPSQQPTETPTPQPSATPTEVPTPIPNAAQVENNTVALSELGETNSVKFTETMHNTGNGWSMDNTVVSDGRLCEVTGKRSTNLPGVNGIRNNYRRYSGGVVGICFEGTDFEPEYNQNSDGAYTIQCATREYCGSSVMIMEYQGKYGVFFTGSETTNVYLFFDATNPTGKSYYDATLFNGKNDGVIFTDIPGGQTLSSSMLLSALPKDSSNTTRFATSFLNAVRKNILVITPLPDSFNGTFNVTTDAAGVSRIFGNCEGADQASPVTIFAGDFTIPDFCKNTLYQIDGSMPLTEIARTSLAAMANQGYASKVVNDHFPESTAFAHSVADAGVLRGGKQHTVIGDPSLGVMLVIHGEMSTSLTEMVDNNQVMIYYCPDKNSKCGYRAITPSLYFDKTSMLFSATAADPGYVYAVELVPEQYGETNVTLGGSTYRYDCNGRLCGNDLKSTEFGGKTWIFFGNPKDENDNGKAPGYGIAVYVHPDGTSSSPTPAPTPTPTVIITDDDDRDDAHPVDDLPAGNDGDDVNPPSNDDTGNGNDEDDLQTDDDVETDDGIGTPTDDGDDVEADDGTSNDGDDVNPPSDDDAGNGNGSDDEGTDDAGNDQQDDDTIGTPTDDGDDAEADDGTSNDGDDLHTDDDIETDDGISTPADDGDDAEADDGTSNDGDDVNPPSGDDTGNGNDGDDLQTDDDIETDDGIGTPTDDGDDTNPPSDDEQTEDDTTANTNGNSELTAGIVLLAAVSSVFICTLCRAGVFDDHLDKWYDKWHKFTSMFEGMFEHKKVQHILDELNELAKKYDEDIAPRIITRFMRHRAIILNAIDQYYRENTAPRVITRCMRRHTIMSKIRKLINEEKGRILTSMMEDLDSPIALQAEAMQHKATALAQLRASTYGALKRESSDESLIRPSELVPPHMIKIAKASDSKNEKDQHAKKTGEDQHSDSTRATSPDSPNTAKSDETRQAEPVQSEEQAQRTEADEEDPVGAVIEYIHTTYGRYQLTPQRQRASTVAPTGIFSHRQPDVPSGRPPTSSQFGRPHSVFPSAAAARARTASGSTDVVSFGSSRARPHTAHHTARL